MRAPRSTRGVTGGVLGCGSRAVASAGCNTHTRAEAAEAKQSRRTSRAPLGALGGISYRRCQPPRDVEAPAAVVRRPSRARQPERVRPPGALGVGLKHRARDVGEMTDLRLLPTSGF